MERQSIQTVYPRVYGIVHGVDQGVLKLSLINNRKYMVGTIHNGQLTTAFKLGVSVDVQRIRIYVQKTP